MLTAPALFARNSLHAGPDATVIIDDAAGITRFANCPVTAVE